MVSCGLVPAVVVLIGVALSARGAVPPPAPDLDRKAAIERATREEKPLVLFARPENCRAPKKAPDPCKTVEAAVRHPAIQRRLQRVVYLSIPTEDERPSVTVHDPSGVPIVRWLGAPDPPTFRHMLTLVDGAAPNLVAAAHARSGGDVRLAAREDCLATLALGNGASGRARLRALRDADDTETQQLATIWLDGKLVATARQAPFAAAVNFGRIPKHQLLELTAFDREGVVIRSASVAVNDRSGDFAIQVVEPAGAELEGPAAVELAVRVPRGRSVVDVVVEWNGSVVARLDAPPWTARVTGVAGELGVLRSAVRLDDGTEREDVRLFNTGAMLFESGVNLVEIPVYAENRKLTAGELTVKEAGRARLVDRVITAAEAPLNVALLLDISKSMSDHVLDLDG